MRGILSIFTVIAIGIVFFFGLGTTVYLSLRSPEVKVPDVVGKDRFEAERVLGDAGLNFRVRAYRPSSQTKADTVLFQLPRGGQVVKTGQTVAMDISRPAKEGEASDVVTPDKTAEEQAANQNTNGASSTNDNKPKRNRNTNKNANDNANSNANNANRSANANHLTTNNRNSNTGNTNRNANANGSVNRPPTNPGNTNRVNQNGNVRLPVTRPLPTPRPTSPNH